MRLFGSDRIAGLVDRLGIPDDMPIDAGILSNTIESAQKKIEDNNFRRRKYVLTYDDVMNQQRNLIYKQRNDVLNGENISETVTKMIYDSIGITADTFLQGEDSSLWDIEGLLNHYKGLLVSEGEFDNGKLASLSKDEIIDTLCDKADSVYESKSKLLGAERFAEIERAILLQNVDRSWMEHIDAMDDLKDTIRLQSYAQRDPITEYRIRGADMFDAMVEDIRDKTARMILSVTVKTPEIKRVQVANPISEGFDNGLKSQKKVTVAKKKDAEVGRNDLCPCGSGKKYKKCCGAPGAENK